MFSEYASVDSYLEKPKQQRLKRIIEKKPNSLITKSWLHILVTVVDQSLNLRQTPNQINIVVMIFSFEHTLPLVYRAALLTTAFQQLIHCTTCLLSGHYCQVPAVKDTTLQYLCFIYFDTKIGTQACCCLRHRNWVQPAPCVRLEQQRVRVCL